VYKGLGFELVGCGMWLIGEAYGFLMFQKRSDGSSDGCFIGDGGQ